MERYVPLLASRGELYGRQRRRRRFEQAVVVVGLRWEVLGEIHPGY
ncbi:MAG: hypothetical protein VX992_02670 [Acidobacteriota bacterium]|nr:hypothetical protein [Acidobacteriota bacterium]